MPTSHAQPPQRNDRIEVRDESRSSGTKIRFGTVLREDAQTVEVLTDAGKITISTADVIDINYDLGSQDWENAIAAERNRQWSQALNFYEIFLQRGARLPFVQRQVEYKLLLMKWMTVENQPQANLQPLQNELRLFIKNNPDCRQVLASIELLGTLLLRSNQPVTEATQLLKQLPSANNSDWNHRCQMLEAQLKLQEAIHIKDEHAQRAQASFTDALNLSQALLSDSNPTRRMDAELLHARAQAGLGKLSDAEQQLHKLLKVAGESETIKAQIHIALGDCYQLQRKYAEAAQQYLLVDVLYNQDRELLARAVAALIQTFERRQDYYHARMYRERLMTDPALKNSSAARVLLNSSSSK